MHFLIVMEFKEWINYVFLFFINKNILLRLAERAISTLMTRLSLVFTYKEITST
jgi:hypothetical protein